MIDILLKVYIQNLSSLEIYTQGFILFEDEDFYVFYSTDLCEKEIQQDVSTLLEEVSANLFHQVSEFKIIEKELSISAIKDKIMFFINKFYINRGLKNSRLCNLINTDTKIITKHNKLSVKLFTEPEFENYKQKVKIFLNIQSQIDNVWNKGE